jgi:general secretion pathway protein I
LEVVVALAVLAMTLGVIYETLGWSLRRSSVAQRKEVAWLQAQTILSSLRAEQGLRAGPQDGSAAGVKWHVDVRQHASQVSESSGLVPFEVVVTVPWGPKPQEQVQLESIELAKRPT